VRLDEVARERAIDIETIEIWFHDEARIGQKNKITRRAGDKSKLDRVQSDVEDDWDRGGRRLGRQSSGGTSRHSNHGHLATNQIGHQRWKSIVSTLRPTIFNRYVPAFDITGFMQASVEGG
jgi:hypothetical protein